jgi:membrane associated rhomboid family serine protease
MMYGLTPVVKNLIIINGAVFLLWLMSDAVGMPDPMIMDKYFYLVKVKTNFYNRYVVDPHPIQILTHFFSHNRFFHLLFNMMALASLGPVVEMVIGAKRFLRFYLFTGIVAGILILYVDPSKNPVIGASGAIFGVLAAFAYMNPRAGLSFFFMPPIQAKYLAIGIGVISLFLVVIDTQRGSATFGISHFGHLAGMIAAVIYFYIEKFLPVLKR